MWCNNIFQKNLLALLLFFVLCWTFWSGQCVRHLSVWNGEVEMFIVINRLLSLAPSTTSVSVVFWDFIARAKRDSAFAETMRPHLPWVGALDFERVQLNKLQ